MKWLVNYDFVVYNNVVSSLAIALITIRKGWISNLHGTDSFVLECNTVWIAYTTLHAKPSHPLCDTQMFVHRSRLCWPTFPLEVKHGTLLLFYYRHLYLIEYVQAKHMSAYTSQYQSMPTLWSSWWVTWPNSPLRIRWHPSLTSFLSVMVGSLLLTLLVIVFEESIYLIYQIIVNKQILYSFWEQNN